MGFVYVPGKTSYSTNTNNYRSSSTSNNKKDDSDTNKGNRTASIKKDGILAGIGFRGRDVDESVDKKNYDDPRSSNLRNQFDYLSDKYYGGSKEDFAKTSQGQVLLNYLSGVPATKGGFLGGDLDVGDRILESDKVSDENKKILKQAFFGNVDAIKNLGTNEDILKQLRNQPEINRTGLLTSPEYQRLNQLILNIQPDAYAKARPIQSGKGLGQLFEKFVPAYIKGPFSNLMPEGATGGLNSDEYLDQDLLNLLEPLDTDQGGMNDVAQAVVNQNQMPSEIDMALIQEYLDSLPEGGINTFDPNSFAFSIG